MDAEPQLAAPGPAPGTKRRAAMRGQFALKNFHSSHLGSHPQKAAGD